MNASEVIAAHGVEVTWTGEGSGEAVDQLCGSDVLYGQGAPRNQDALPARNYASSVPDSEILVDCPGDPACPQCGILHLPNSGLIQPVLLGRAEPTPHQITSPRLEVGANTYELAIAARRLPPERRQLRHPAGHVARLPGEHRRGDAQLSPQGAG